VEEAIRKGIGHVWMQPAPRATGRCRLRGCGINVIADGSCLLVVLGYSERGLPASSK